MNDDAAVLAIVCYGEGEEDAAVALGKLVFVGMIHNKDKDTGESSWVQSMRANSVQKDDEKNGLCILRMQTRESLGILLRAI